MTDRMLPRKIGPRALAALLCLLFLGLTLSGCLSAKKVSDRELICVVPAGAEDISLLSFFLNLRQPAGPHLNLEITAIEIASRGMWLPITLGTKVLDTEKIGAGQVALGQTTLEPGVYEKIRLTLSPEASITVAGKRADLRLAESQVEIPFGEPVNLGNGASESFFLDWDVEASLDGPASLVSPVIDLRGVRVSPITANRIYVSCPDINTIYSVRADKRWVDRSFYVPGRPTYIAMDNARQRLYVLCREDADIKVIDLVTSVITDVINLPMTFEPVFMRIDDDLSHAFIIDDHGAVSKVDLQSGNIVARKETGQKTSYIEHLPASRSVAVSSDRDSRVYLLDDDTLEVKGEIAISGKPAGLLAKEDYLYIAEEQADMVTIYDTRQRVKLKSMFVGNGPRRLIDQDNNIYAANSRSGTLSLLRTTNLRVVKEIPLGNEIYEMASSGKEQLIYIGKKVKEDCGGSLSILDVTSSSIIGEIELGSRPLGIVVGQ
ncbi:MAG: hypothetical protein RQ753_02885 [Desulfurivibrionaceae bacterium]|nr:hypothetical protein [Desulfobulbales bacterium]MDT8334619.1 hypothetical protein [Desulfurivibrionaceae bacterium]